MKLSERVKACREAAGLTQIELAQQAGVSQQLIAKLETGDVLETRKLYKIVQSFGMTLDEFFCDGQLAMTPKGFGKLIREKRRAQEMTQSELADRIGVTKGAVSHWELGRVEGIEPVHLHWLSKVLFLRNEELALFQARPKLEFAQLPPLPQSDMEVIHLYAALPENVRRHVRGIIEALSTSQGDRYGQEAAAERGDRAPSPCEGACVQEHRRVDGGEDHAEGSQRASSEGECGVGQGEGSVGAVASAASPAVAHQAKEEKNGQIASELLSANVRALIERVGSGAELARLTGVPQKTISRIANGENAVTLDTLNDLAKGAGLQPWHLLLPQQNASAEPPIFVAGNIVKSSTWEAL